MTRVLDLLRNAEAIKAKMSRRSEATRVITRLQHALVDLARRLPPDPPDPPPAIPPEAA